MVSATDNLRLSEISTVWHLVRQAHSSQRKDATPAQMRLLLRYYTAVNRYLLGALRDAAAAEDLGQEFALRFIRGDFQGADPQRGRFRDYLRTVLSRMAVQYHKQRQAQPCSLPAGVPTAPTAEAPKAEPDFVDVWRQELLDRAWKALAQVQKKTGQPFHTVLAFRAEHPEGDCSAAQIADHLATTLGRCLTPEAVRKLLQRARQKFADFLLDEVAESLEGPPPERLELELRDLGLLAYCRPALRRRKEVLAEGRVAANAV
jgi:RNA polymerase sigma-70 factor (ECF subfamily)